MLSTKQICWDEDGYNIIGSGSGELISYYRLRTPDISQRNYLRTGIAINKLRSNRWEDQEHTHTISRGTVWLTFLLKCPTTSWILIDGYLGTNIRHSVKIGLSWMFPMTHGPHNWFDSLCREWLSDEPTRMVTMVIMAVDTSWRVWPVPMRVLIPGVKWTYCFSKLSSSTRWVWASRWLETLQINVPVSLHTSHSTTVGLSQVDKTPFAWLPLNYDFKWSLSYSFNRLRLQRGSSERRFDRNGSYSKRGCLLLAWSRRRRSSWRSRMGPNVEGLCKEDDPRGFGPMYIGAFPSVQEGLYAFPHPEMGPILKRSRRKHLSLWW